MEPPPVPIQVLFATSTSAGVVVDGLVLARGPDDGVGAGEPFSLLMERNPVAAEDEEALGMLRRWSDGASVVEVSTAHGGRWLVLRSGGDELVLVIS